MNNLANAPSRPYQSRLRTEQARDTRARILDATARVVADGFASVSIPAVAREAEVSVPTVYRHFKSKRKLLEALYPHAVRRAGLGDLPTPTSIDDLRSSIVALLERFEAFDDLDRAVMASPASEEIRQFSMPARVARARQTAEAIAPSLPAGDRERVARLLVILTTSAASRMWLEHLGLSVDEAADDVDWIMRTVIAGAADGTP